MKDLEKRIELLIDIRKKDLHDKIDLRNAEMIKDSNDHYMLYNLLGIDDSKGFDIDLYQNIGRFLYRHSGELIEEIALETILFKYPDAKVNFFIPNNISSNPKNFEIDCLVKKTPCSKPDAIEIKWRDATTDGDHIRKERNLVLATINEGYNPIRVMFFYPNRAQAIRVQDNLKQYYIDNNAEFYAEQDAWDFIFNYTGVDLKKMLSNMTSL